jgi:hypothetical protein
MQKRTEMKMQQTASVAAAAPSVAADMTSYIGKRARANAEAVTGGGDLVADAAKGRTSVAAVKDADLPENLRAMKPEQREAEVAKQVEQRKTLNEKLAALVAKRDKYIADQAVKSPKTSSFDGVVQETLTAQIKR